MARMFPDRMPEKVKADPARAAEREVYEVLGDELPDRYSVFAWVSWILKNPADRAYDGEADFVIADPDRGLLVLEVKGGAIERDGSSGRWFSTDRAGNRYPIDDPFEQAKDNCYRLMRKLAGQPAWKHGAPSTWHAVAFPSVQDAPPDLGPAAPRDVVITRRDLGWLEKKLRQVFEFWQGGDKPASPPGVDGIASLQAFLAPTRKLKTPLIVNVEQDARRLDELTEHQFDVLDLMGPRRRVLVQGGPGTGKTVLALEKATRLARDEGFRTLLTCFNRPLADQLASSAAGIQNLSVHCFHDLCYLTARAAGLEVQDPRSAAVPNAYFRTTLPELFAAALDRTGERFDAVVVDEGQDFSAIDRTALELALVDRDHSVLYVFQDATQRVYLDGEVWPEAGFVPADLPRNLRNTTAIHEAVCRVSGDRKTRPSGVAGTKPEFVTAGSLDEQRESLRKVLHRLLIEEHVPARSIVVLGSTRRALDKLLPGRKVGSFKLTDDHAGDPRQVLIESITRFKGLEREVAVLVGLEPVDYCNFEALLCVGASRARAHLVVIGPPDVVGRFAV